MWSRRWFTDRAACWPGHGGVIEQVLDRHQIEAQGYLDAQNILKPLGKRNKAKLEAACQQLLNVGAHPTYSTLKRLLAGIDSDTKKPAPVRAAASNRNMSQTVDQPPTGCSVRGAGYRAWPGDRLMFTSEDYDKVPGPADHPRRDPVRGVDRRGPTTR